jgi:4-amino-4-deoxy-L-arabinose transferase-like glycosyltransferase
VLLSKSWKFWAGSLWLVLIIAFALLRLLHLDADFPNHTLWVDDFAKFTDEGWWANAAVQAHLTGNWYVPGDFNPAPAVPVWPFLLWIVFFFTGVSIVAARAVAVVFFFLNMLLSYGLMRSTGPRWRALLALTLMATSPFLYCFGRLALLEPLLTACTLATLNLAVRLPRSRHPYLVSTALGLLYTCMLLTKTSAVFLLPAIAWAAWLPLRHERRLAWRATLTAAAASLASFGLWMGLVFANHLYADYKYLFFINKYEKPTHFYWPLLSLWWSFHGGLWIDVLLVPLTGLLIVAAVLFSPPVARRLHLGSAEWARGLVTDPLFGACFLAVAGYIGFMTVQNHPQPRYFAVVAVFLFILTAQGVAALVSARGSSPWPRRAGWLALSVALLAAGFNAVQTATYAAHPEYTFLRAAQGIRAYIDAHPNGNRVLISISGDQLELMTGLPSLCDDFGTQELVSKLDRYHPGWWATWNEVDPGTLEDLHRRYDLEQVAAFPAYDHPDRNLLVLFKLHPIHGAQRDDADPAKLQQQLPTDTIDIDVD